MVPLFLLLGLISSTFAFMCPSSTFSSTSRLFAVNPPYPASTESPLRIGTRGSPLALAQAYLTRELLQDKFPELKEEGALEICVLKTQGDMVLDKSLMELGGKGLFTKELDVALLNDEVDICVHSMKDVPTILPPNTHLSAMLEREDTRDVFITGEGGAGSIEGLADGSVIGTASLRRQSQILAKNPTLKCVNFRGNVQTRLRKLDDGVVDATLLALAGLKRMGMEGCATKILEKEDMVPAVAQGAIGLQIRSDDARSVKYSEALNHEQTRVCVEAERSFLGELDGNCRTPIAGQCWVGEGGEVLFEGLVSLPDGSLVHRTNGSCPSISEAISLGKSLGKELKERAGGDFFQKMVEMSPQMEK